MSVQSLPVHDLPNVSGHANSGGAVLRDACGRTIDHLRLSVTSACDLKCIYCRPRRTRGAADQRSLSDSQRAEFVAFLHRGFALAQVRITGGEPLLHKGVVELVRSIRRAAPRIEIAMTTNGRRLAGLAQALRSAGLDRLNVSLDSLDAVIHRRMTGGELHEVLDGLAAAASAGFPPAKINTVVLRGFNDADIAELASWALARSHEIRFLEAMPIGPAADTNRRHFVSARQMRERLGERFTLESQPPARGETARRFIASSERHCGVIGIISPVTEPFCGNCRRIRLTADGRLFPCLLDSRWVDLGPAWAAGRFDADVAENIVLTAADGKAPAGAQQVIGMVSLGG